MRAGPVEVLCLGMLLAAIPAGAGERSAKSRPGGEPSLELLEFLGTWETPDGQWVDPLSLVRERETRKDRGADKDRDGKRMNAQTKVPEKDD